MFSMPAHSSIKTSSSKIISFDFAINDENDIILFWIDSMPTNNLQRITLKTNIDLDNIKDSRFDGINSTLLTTNKMKDSMIKALSVDCITLKVYLIENDMIKTVDYDGKNKKTIIDAGLNAWDIALDPESRKMFWSTMLRAIYVSSMDGSDKKRFVSENIEFASSLTIDSPSRRIYWCDLRKSTIETVTLDGTDRQIVKKFDSIDPINKLPVSPMKLDVFEDELFIIMTNQTLYKLNKFGHKRNYEELSSGPHRFKVSHIKIIHTFKRNNSLPNPCQLNPCDKTAICLLSSSDPHGRTCNCPDNLYVQKNGSNVQCLSKTEIPSLCYKKCTNGGTCRYVNESMICECAPQFEGEFCEHYICSEYCKNNGVCVIPTNSRLLSSEEMKAKRYCHCTSQWKGAQCDVPANACKVSYNALNKSI